jgi:putative (di)nucleoside polyphosphate hydrolase
MKSKPLRQAALALFVKKNGTFLIGSSPRDGGYKFPQGGLNKDETPEQGLIREIKEELGTELCEDDIILKLPKTFIYSYPASKTYSKIYDGQELHCFVIRHRSEMVITPQDDEFEDLIWIEQSEMKKFNFEHRAHAYLEMVHSWIDLKNKLNLF